MQALMRSKLLFGIVALLVAAIAGGVVYGVARATGPKTEWREIATLSQPTALPTERPASPTPSPSSTPSSTPSADPTLIPTAAPPPRGDGRDSQIVNQASMRCLDDPNSDTGNGTKLIIWDCHGPDNQRWTWTPKGELQVLGKCMQSARRRAKAGTKVVIGDCRGSSQQRWFLNADGTITADQSGLCLDLHDGRVENATELRLERCTGAASQRWTRG